MQALRGLVAASHPDISEHVKWNGPSFVIDGDAGLVKWAAVDRGVVTFADAAEVEAAAEPFKALCRRWLDATR